MGQACGCFAGVTGGTPVESKALAKTEPAQQVREPDQKTPLVPAPVPAPSSVEAHETTPLVPAASAMPAPTPEPSPAPLSNSVEPEKPCTMPEPESNAIPSTQEATRGAEVPGEAVGHSGPVIVGSFMEVYSNSSQAWCPGVIYDMDNSSVLMAYQVPCVPNETPSDASIRIKTLPLDSPELRVATDTGAWLGAEVEVFSDASQDWCPGKIDTIKNGVAGIAVRYPESGQEGAEDVEKTESLQLGDKYIQLPGAKAAMQFSTGADGFAIGSPVEVYSNSLGTWCYGVIQEIVDGMASIAFYYPDMDPHAESPAIKQLPLGHPDFRLPTTASAIPDGFLDAGVPESELLPGVAVEVYSESRGYWIPGKVASVRDGIVTATLRYPDMPPEQAEYDKELPVGHQYLRLHLDPAAGLEVPAPSSSS